MGDFRVIGDIARSLQRVLERDPWEGMGAKPEIVFRPPGTEEPGNPSRVCIMLFYIEEKTPGTGHAPGRYGPSEGLPLVLDLSYLITAYSSDAIQEQYILGKVMEILHDHAIIAGPDLQGSLAGTGTNIRLSLHHLSPGERAGLWDSFHRGSPHTSVCYVAAPAEIESGRRSGMNKRLPEGGRGMGL